MDYMNLSDEEILQAIAAARKNAVESGKPFNIRVIESALNALELEREERELAVLKENPMYVQNVEVKDNGEKTVLESRDMEGLLDEYDVTISDLFKSIEADLLSKKGNKEYEEFIKKVYGGAFSPEEMNTLLETKFFFEYESKPILKQINSLAREKYYSYCKLCEDQEFIDKGKWMTQVYDSIYKRILEIEKKASTRSRESTSKKSNEPTMDQFTNGLRNMRIGFIKGDFGGVWPASFESKLEFLHNFAEKINLDMSYDTHLVPNLETIQKMREMVDKLRYSYLRIDVEEMRNIAISNMNLSSEEVKLFESHMKNNLESRETRSL